MIAKLKHCFNESRVLYSHHARQQMEREPLGRIFEHDVRDAVNVAEVIEDYPVDEPYPSCLIFGRTRSGRPIHAVCAYVPEENRAIIITVYEPDPNRWTDYRRRRTP